MAPAPADVLAAVMGQRQEVAALFDALREGSRDGEGVSRDTYGPGEQFAHRLIGAHAEKLGLETCRDHAVNLYLTSSSSGRCC